MGVQVVNVVPNAAMSARNARASLVVTVLNSDEQVQVAASRTTAEVAQSKTTAIIPLSEVLFVTLVPTTHLDDTGRFSFRVDSVATTDGVVVQAEKGFRETIITSESKAFATGLGKHETVTFSEVVTRTLIFLRAYTDTVLQSEQISLALSRPLSDMFTQLDSMSRTTGKSLTDALDTSDYLSSATAKGLADSFGFAETPILSTAKPLTDSWSLTDSATIGFSTARSDSFALSDSSYRQFSKGIADGFSMNDSADLADGVAFQSSKGISNVVFATDGTSFGVARVSADSVTPSSSGSLRSQGYCDFSYFSEDYVGASRTFS